MQRGILVAKSWMVIAVGDDRTYRGNTGYADDPSRIYRYTDSVQNHRQLHPGHLVLIREKRRLLGVARIQEIRESIGSRTQRRCPECDIARLIVLKRGVGGYRCENGHWFATPATRELVTTFYEADFGTSFIPTPDAVPLRALIEACPKYNPRVAMQWIELEKLAHRLVEAEPAVSRLLEGDYLGVDDSAEDDAGSGYIPSTWNAREQTMRAIRLRRGQHAFRQRLRDRYGDRCMMSGCAVMHAVEAAHISPFRSDDDHHEENGLLLRADLHTLFDLDLIGINPDTLDIALHPDIRSGEYSRFQGLRLNCPGDARPSSSALAFRWRLFRAQLP